MFESINLLSEWLITMHESNLQIFNLSKPYKALQTHMLPRDQTLSGEDTCRTRKGRQRTK